MDTAIHTKENKWKTLPTIPASYLVIAELITMILKVSIQTPGMVVIKWEFTLTKKISDNK